MVVEYAALGDLRQFLQDRRPGLEYESGPQSPEVLTMQDLLSFCYQVSKGMEFLSSRKVNTADKKLSHLNLVNSSLKEIVYVI